MDTTTQLKDAIIEGMKKGHGLVDLDLTSLHATECDHFIICHGNSTTQVEAIARSVEETTKEMVGEDALHIDGQWILLDYSDIMVHVFQKDIRNFYDIESLWADAHITEYNEDN